MFTVPSVDTYRHHMPDMSVQHAAESYHDMPTEHSALIDLSYSALRITLIDQYNALIHSGLTIVHQPGDAYADSKQMRADVAEGRIKVRSTFTDDYADLTEGHPMAQFVMLADGTVKVLNDVFRAVHDVYGHYQASAGFGPDGEALAWLTHRSTMPAEALLALWCETRGQNAWTNWYGRDLPIADRPFAAQKFGVVLSDLI